MHPAVLDKETLIFFFRFSERLFDQQLGHSLEDKDSECIINIGLYFKILILLYAYDTTIIVDSQNTLYNSNIICI